MTIPSLKYMLFLSMVYLLYLPINRRYKALFLLAVSWVFYAICQPRFLLLLCHCTLVSYISAIEYEKKRFQLRKTWIVAGTVILIGTLFLFKYLDFFVDTCFLVIGKESVKNTDRLLPIGISFYTFTALSYLFDVAQGKIAAERNFVNCALVISFFPAILSGPISRAEVLLPQIHEPAERSFVNLKRGLLRIAVGSVKKIVVSNTLGLFVDAVYRNPDAVPKSVTALAIISYSFQIYFDFSGYTDIALGSAQIFGVVLPENFAAPYFAKSVRDFWRRWHISLTSWFRDYLYIPLGGSRVNRRRLIFNILIVFTVSGLWHGAAWSFVVWGLLNGLFQVIEVLFMPFWERKHRRLSFFGKTVHSVFQILITFALVSFAWVFFRAGSITLAFRVLNSLLNNNVAENGMLSLRDFTDLRPLALALIFVLGFSLLDYCKVERKINYIRILSAKTTVYWFALSLLVAFTAVFGVYGGGYNANSFIYFQF